MCSEVVTKWAARIRTRWPRAEQETPRCLEPMILDGSRDTDQGWKVSYHVIYPWLTFPCNNTTLRDEVTRLSEDPTLQYHGTGGVKRFIDPAVYTRKQAVPIAVVPQALRSIAERPQPAKSSTSFDFWQGMHLQDRGRLVAGA